MVGAGDAGTVAGLYDAAAVNAVDEGGFAHVGDADDHQAHGLFHAALGGAFHGGLGCLFDLGKDFLGLAAIGVEAHGGEALLAEVFHPARSFGVIGQVGLVENQDARLVTGQLFQVRVTGGLGRTGVAQLDHCVYGAQLFLQKSAGFGHVARIPVDLRHNMHS